MLRVKNKDGLIVHGLLKPCDGVLVVSDHQQYDKYKKQVSQQEKIIALEQQVEKLSGLIQQLLDNSLNG